MTVYMLRHGIVVNISRGVTKTASYGATYRIWFRLPVPNGRPKKCAQCEPPLPALGNEQDHKVAAQCADGLLTVKGQKAAIT